MLCKAFPGKKKSNPFGLREGRAGFFMDKKNGGKRLYEPGKNRIEFRKERH